jgi:polar amino acid transport system substrate-binding protein
MNRRRSVIVILVLGMFLSMVGIAYAQKTITISTINGSVTDVAEKVMTEAYKRLGITLEVKRFPGERALQLSNSGETDGELYRKRDIDKVYPNLILIPIPVVDIDEMVFTKRNNNFAVKGWESLLPYTVGYRIGIKIIESNLVKGTKAETVATLEQLFTKLELGRNDVVIETRLSGLQTIKALGLKDIVILEPPLVKSPLFHFLHVKNKGLVEPLTAVLKQMEKDGVIRNIQLKALDQSPKSPSK